MTTKFTNRNIKIDEYDNNGNKLCGAEKTSSAGTCQNLAGFRTNHLGRGRCFMHEETIEGMKNSKFDIPAIRERLNDFLEDTNILSLDNEIALNRAYLELTKNYIQILSDENLRNTLPENSKISLPQLTDTIVRVTNTIGKLVKTKSEIEVGRKYVVHINVFQSIIGQVADVIDANVVDVETKRNIIKSLGAISLPMPE